MKDKKKRTKKEVPFFARYLEGQELARVGGSTWVTRKIDDSEEYVTLKYPSDDDEAPTT